MTDKIDDYLNRGIHGAKETKKEERKVYLTAIRERIILALTDGQVMKNNIYEPIKQLIKEHPDCQLFLDGEVNYRYLSKYIKVANNANIPFTIVDDLKNETDIGLVLASTKAINKPNIFVDNF